MPFRSDDGIYEEGFIEERRSALEAFVNKIAGALSNSYILDSIGILGHPLAQNERCLHMFLQVGRTIVFMFVSCKRNSVIDVDKCKSFSGSKYWPELRAWQDQKHIEQNRSILLGKEISRCVEVIFLIHPYYPCDHAHHLYQHSFSLWQQTEISVVLRNAFLVSANSWVHNFIFKHFATSHVLYHQSSSTLWHTESQL